MERIRGHGRRPKIENQSSKLKGISGVALEM